MPLVSIVIPAYNSSKVIKATLLSVIDQTYSNIEVIIVDDYSDDFLALSALIDSLNDTRINLHRLKEKGNGAIARNYGASLSKGSVLCFLDADDIWETSKIKLQLDVLDKAGNNAVITCRSRVINDGKIEKVSSKYDSSLDVANNLFGSLEHNLIFQTSTIMMYTSFFLKVGGYDPNLFRHQDYQLAFSLEEGGAEFHFLDEALSNYIKTKEVDISKKGWSIQRSGYFIEQYISYFSHSSLRNFLVVQLLGPSIKTKALKSWFHLRKIAKVRSYALLFTSGVYLCKRLLKKLL